MKQWSTSNLQMLHGTRRFVTTHLHISTIMRRDVFQAIADPTRRNILQLIASTPMNVNSIAENFKMSRPAISQHVKILEECGLVEARTIGRERHCHATLSPLAAVQTWIQLIHGPVQMAAPKVRAAKTPTARPVVTETTPVAHAEPIKEKKNKKQEKKNKKKKAKKEGKKVKKEKKG